MGFLFPHFLYQKFEKKIKQKNKKLVKFTLEFFFWGKFLCQKNGKFSPRKNKTLSVGAGSLAMAHHHYHHSK
jgi:hypothetical protein